MSVLNKYIFAGFEDDFWIDLTKLNTKCVYVCVCVVYSVFIVILMMLKHYFCIIIWNDMVFCWAKLYCTGGRCYDVQGTRRETVAWVSYFCK